MLLKSQENLSEPKFFLLFDTKMPQTQLQPGNRTGFPDFQC